MDFTPGSEIRKQLNQDFMQEKYQEFRSWYFNNHTTDELQQLKNQYYYHLEKYQTLRPFLEWYYEFSTVMEFIPTSQINVLENMQRTWQTVGG